MITVSSFLFVLGLVLLLLAGLKIPEHPRTSYGWLGLLFIYISQLVK